MTERYGLAVIAFAARRIVVSHRRGCRVEISKRSNFWPCVKF